MGYIFKARQMTCLLAVGIFPNTESELMQWVLPTVETWCDRVGLLVLVVFARRRKLPDFFEPHYVGLL